VVATLGLLMVILALARTRRLATIPAAVGAYIAGGYFFTSFANPAIAIGRTLADTFAGIASASVPRFTLAQLIGTAIAVATIRPLYPDIRPADAAAVPLPHRS
jgi:arsenate reductase